MIGEIQRQLFWQQNDRILKEKLPRSVGAQHATGDQWRNNSRKNEGIESKTPVPGNPWGKLQVSQEWMTLASVALRMVSQVDISPLQISGGTAKENHK